MWSVTDPRILLATTDGIIGNDSFNERANGGNEVVVVFSKGAVRLVLGQFQLPHQQFRMLPLDLYLGKLTLAATVRHRCHPQPTRTGRARQQNEVRQTHANAVTSCTTHIHTHTYAHTYAHTHVHTHIYTCPTPRAASPCDFRLSVRPLFFLDFRQGLQWKEEKKNKEKDNKKKTKTKGKTVECGMR